MTTIDYFGEREPLRVPPSLEPKCYLGNGGMGSVYRLDDTTAVKYVDIAPLDAKREGIIPVSVRYLKKGVIAVDGLFFPLLPKEQALLRQAVHEYRVMEELRDVPAVIQPKGYDFVESHGSLGMQMMMNYVPGKTLSEWLDDGLPLRDVAKATADTAKAVDSLSRYGVIHGDVKPGNVMYTSGVMPGSGEATLIDLGLAKREVGRPFLSESSLSNDLSRLLNEEYLGLCPGSVQGTPGYFSPEQIRGEPLTHQSDIFGLGVLAFEAFTGAPAFPPFDCDGQADAFSKMFQLGRYDEQSKQRLIARLREYVLPADLVAAIGFALDEVPQRRQLEPLQREAQKLADTSIDTIVQSEPTDFCYRTTHYLEEKPN